VGRILNSLLQISRNEHAHGVTVDRIDLGALCERLIDEIQVRHPALSMTLDRAGSPVIGTDGELVGEAVSNLLDNAARHASSSIVVRVAVEGDAASIEVVDDGPGIPPSEAERIFERFVSIGGHPGAGLGLPIAPRRGPEPRRRPGVDRRVVPSGAHLGVRPTPEHLLGAPPGDRSTLAPRPRRCEAGTSVTPPENPSDLRRVRGDVGQADLEPGRQGADRPCGGGRRPAG